ncbi:MAG: photosystem II protein Y [Cyanobacteria bacterium]|jgi:photosystem II PsbY protein|nr:photosystem II protein Y [Cyanobacteria bacterium GSL.Bin1]
MDWRIVIVLAPVILAASWALFNIGAAAIRQAQDFLNNQNT